MSREAEDRLMSRDYDGVDDPGTAWVREEGPQVRLRCQHCNYEWGYKGKRKWRTNCPSCGYNVYIRKATVKG